MLKNVLYLTLLIAVPIIFMTNQIILEKIDAAKLAEGQIPQEVVPLVILMTNAIATLLDALFLFWLIRKYIK